MAFRNPGVQMTGFGAPTPSTNINRVLVVDADSDPDGDFPFTTGTIRLVSRDGSFTGEEGVAQAVLEMAGDYHEFADAFGAGSQLIAVDAADALRALLSAHGDETTSGVRAYAAGGSVQGGIVLIEAATGPGAGSAGKGRVVIAAGGGGQVSTQDNPVNGRIILESDDPIRLRKTALDTSGCGLEMPAQAALGNAQTDCGRLFMEKVAGKINLYAIFPSGAKQLIAAEP